MSDVLRVFGRRVAGESSLLGRRRLDGHSTDSVLQNHGERSENTISEHEYQGLPARLATR